MPTVTVHGFILTVAAVAGVHISPRLAYRAEHVHTRGRIPSASALPAGRYVGCAAGSRRSAPPVLFFDQYDKDAMRLIMDAQTEARQLGVEAIGTDHLLLSATLQRDGVAAALKRSGVETKAVRDELARAAGGGVSAGNPLEKLFASTAKDELLPFASDTERSLRAALDDAKGRGAELVSPKGLMLSAVAEGASDGGSAAALLASLGVDVAAVVKELKRSDAEAVGAGGERRKGGNSTLEQCSVDLTQRAREGKLDPCVGRADEVRRCMKILVRRRKSNPVLIGDPVRTPPRCISPHISPHLPTSRGPDADSRPPSMRTPAPWMAS